MYPVLLLIYFMAIGMLALTVLSLMAAKKKRPKKGEKGYRAPKKTFTFSIMRFVYIIYIIKALTGKRPRDILAEFLDGNIKDVMIENALNILDIVEERGLEIAVEASFVAFIMAWFRKAVGSRSLLKIGPLRITV